MVLNGKHKSVEPLELSLSLEPAENPCFRHHSVYGKALFPTDAYLELIFVVARSRLGLSGIRLEDLVLAAPLVADSERSWRLRVLLRPEGNGWSFAIKSEVGALGKVHAKGRLYASESSRPVPRLARPEASDRRATRADVYDRHPFLRFGGFYQTIDELWMGSSWARSSLVPSEDARRLEEQFLLSPPVANGLLMTGLHFAIELSESGDSVFLPVSVEKIEIPQALRTAPHRAVARLRENTGESMLFDLELVDSDERVALSMQGLRVARVAAETLGAKSEQLLRSAAARPASGGERPVSSAPVSAPHGHDREGIAVIGFSGRFPGAGDCDALWRNLIQGVSSVSEVPIERWDNAAYYDPDARRPHRTISKWGGFLDDVSGFEPEFFGISPMEAEIMDPQQRLFLEEAYHALENAGLREQALKDKTCAVFVGASTSDYDEVLSRHEQSTSAQAFTGLSPAVLAGRISYFLDLKGPALTVDTACSSSLVAVSLACQNLLAGESDLALAGGVHLMLTPRLHIKASKAGMLSRSGACRPFDKSADGIALGEAVGAVVLKRLSDAVRDGDPIRAVVRGFGMNQDGRTNGITAPNPAAQERMELDVYRRFGIDPRRIGFVEAHGTGTSLGDPVEVEALTRAFRHHTPDRQFCALGSIKANIGHTAFSAGIASFIKALLALEQRVIPPASQFVEPNSRIDFDTSPFYVVREPTLWRESGRGPRMAAVSSFGFSGTSCHIVLEEATENQSTSGPAKPAYLIPVSAKSPGALLGAVRGLHAWLSEHECALPDLSYTLIERRTHFKSRVALVVSSRDELFHALARVLEEPAPAQIAIVSPERDRARRRKRFEPSLLDPVQYRSALEELGRAYVAGEDITWNDVADEGPCRVLALPGYFFQRRRCWVEGAPVVSADTLHAPPASGTSAPAGPVRCVAPGWERRDGEHAPSTVLGTLVVFEDDDDVYRELVTAASATRGIQVKSGANFRRRADDSIELDPGVEEHLQQLVEVLGQRPRPVTIVHAWCRDRLADDEVGLQLQKRRSFYCLRYLSSALLRSPLAGEVPLLFLHASDGESFNPIYSGIGALLRTLIIEAPKLLWRSVESSDSSPRALASLVARELSLASETGSFRYDASGVRQREVLRPVAEGARLDGPSFRRGGCYLLTGGAGALGSLVARRLAEAHQARLVLLGRSEPNEQRRRQLEDLERHGGRALYLSCDVGDRVAVARAIERARVAVGPLNGVIHAAGNLRTRMQGGSLPALESVLRPKIDGLLALDHATRDEPLDFFALFSSISSALGNAGQSDYAYANGFMDHYAVFREQLRQVGRRSGTSVSMGWPLWREGRLRVDPGLERLVSSTTGTGVLETEQGLALLEDILRGTESHVVVLPSPVDDAARAVSSRKLEPTLVGAESASHAEASRSDTTAVAVRGDSPSTRSPASVQQLLIDEIVALLKVDRASVTLDDDLADFGFDSIILTELTNRLNERLGLEVTPALLFEYATVRALADFLSAQKGTVDSEPLVRVEPPSTPPVELEVHDPPSEPLHTNEDGARQSNGERRTEGSSPRRDVAAGDRPEIDESTRGQGGVAVIGVFGEMPASDNLEEFWESLVARRVLVSDVPESRWDPARSKIKKAAFLRQVDGFDAAFFGVPPREAELMDPQQRMLLETIWRAIEDAGYKASSLWDSRTGLFVGAATSDYATLLKESGLDVEALAPTGTSSSLLANRASYYFNWHGPSELCNTACSSSLLAVHRACEALERDHCDQAVAAGVNLLLTPALFSAFDAAGMLTPDGMLRAFDEGANGYVRGEGVGALVLKPLHRALADRDHIYGVIRATATNHGGRATSLTAPSPNAQASLLLDAYRRAGVAPDRVSYIEAHGSGTALGDPIEINGIKKAFEALYGEWGIPYDRLKRCQIGSVKGNVGHLEAAAGMAGVVKVLLALRHRTIPGNATLSRVNPQVLIDDTPFEIAGETRSWPAASGADGGSLRVAGVSSFGFGGTNVHVVIEEHTVADRLPEAPSEHAFVLSARTQPALRDYARRVALELGSARLAGVGVGDIAYTFQVGREEMAERLSFVVGDRDELRLKLKEFAESGEVEGCFRGSVEAALKVPRPPRMAETDAGDHRLAPGDLASACEAWVHGAEVDWEKLSHGSYRRVSCTVYPFQRKSYWCTAALGYSRGRVEAVDRARHVASPAAGSSPDVPRAAAKLTLKRNGAGAHEVFSAPMVPDLAGAERGSDLLGLNLPPAASNEASVVEARVVATAPSQSAARARIKQLLAETLHVDERELGEDKPFAELGLDSILALEFAKRVGEAFGRPLRAVDLFDYGTIARLAQALTREAGPMRSGESAEVPRATSNPAPANEMTSSEGQAARGEARHSRPSSSRADSAPAGEGSKGSADIAVIGMAAKLPGADDVGAFWENLKRGVCSIGEVPAERWATASDGRGNSASYRWGGFIDDVDKFDPLFFSLSPNEAKLMDPQQRLFLETCWAALEDAGYSAERLDGMRCGVHAGVMNNDYYELLVRDPEAARQAQTMTGNATSMLAGRVAYLLNLKGPAVQMDTACSSSLVAVHWAAKALLDDEAEMMLAGGVTLYLAESSFAKMNDAGMLSPSGRCRTFDAEADGFVPGEGAAVLVLKRLDRAVRDGDRIYGVIKGTAVNQDGKTNGITAPSAQSQAELETGLYRRFGIDPATITYVESHGTGTKLGDPIEVAALTQAFRAFTTRAHYCAIGSAKTNIGHTAAAAGAAGLIKVLLAMQHGQIPPSLHFNRANPLMELDSGPLFVSNKLSGWVPAEGCVRRAAVSSFGFSGTNVHLVVDEHAAPAPDDSPPEQQPQLIVLSARTPERLEAYARSIADHLANRSVELELADVAHTLQVGRTAMEARLAFVATSLTEARLGLERACRQAAGAGPCLHRSGAGPGESAWMLEGPEGERFIEELLRRRDLDKLARLWTTGVRLDWTSLHTGVARRPRIVSLPTYPFARERCWLPEPVRERGTPADGVKGVEVSRRQGRPVRAGEAPRVPSNLRWGELRNETPGTHTFRAEVPASHPIVREHRVRNEPLLPGMLCLTLVEAAARALGREQARFAVRMAFLAPVRVDGACEIEITVSEKGQDLEVVLQSRDERGRSIEHATGTVEPAEHLAEGAADPVDVVKARCSRSVPGRELYSGVTKLGLDYGASFQGVKHLWIGDDEVLAEIELPEPAVPSLSGEFDRAVVLDCALHGLAMPELEGQERPSGKTLLVPFSIRRVVADEVLPRRGVAHAQRRDRGGASYDVALYDERGQLRATFEEVVLRPVQERGPTLFVPSWTELPVTDTAPARREQGASSVVICHGDEPGDELLAKELASKHSRAGDRVKELRAPLLLDASDASQSVVGGEHDVVYFLDSGDPSELHGLETEGEVARIDAAVTRAVRGFFRLVKALLQAGAADRALTLKVVTRAAHDVTGDELVRPEAASLSAFASALAREQPRWSVTCTDLGRAESMEAAAAAIYARAPLAGHVEVAIRGRRSYARVLRPLVLPDSGRTSAFRRHGVYFIVGGLGGIGFELCKRLARKFSARLVVIGRGALDRKKQVRLDELAALGGEALYLPADVSDLTQLRASYREACARFGRIDGVIHSAIVLSDATVANLREQDLQTVLAPKVVGTAVLFEVFRGVALDFMVFFSSAASFSTDPGQSNYAAASRFEDSFAALRRRSLDYPVLVVNWGYWGSVGIVANERYRRELARRGVESIEPDEGLSIFETLLSHRERLHQVAVLKGDVSGLSSLPVSASMRRELLPAAAVQVSLDPLPGLDPYVDRLEGFEHGFERLDSFGHRAIMSGLRRYGIVTGIGERFTVEELGARANVVPAQAKLFVALVRALENAGYFERTGLVLSTTSRIDDVYASRALLEVGARRLADELPELEPHVRLLHACAGACVDVLSGRIAPQEVMFPGGSTSLVEGVYTGPVLSVFNDLCAEVVREQVVRRLGSTSQSRVTVLEVGAGTGGTSRSVLRALASLGERVRYVYTDVSAAFVQHGIRSYRSEYPFVEGRVLDINAPLDSGVPMGSIDIVLGANVLHATRDIRESVLRLKALLKAGGLLLLNETTAIRDYLTFTFGMLADWWSFEDDQLRIPGSPLLTPASWRAVLGDAGFGPVRSIEPAHAVGRSDHSLVVGASDGVIDLEVAAPGGRRVASHSRQASPQTREGDPEQKVALNGAGARGDLRRQSLDYVKHVFSEVLGIPTEQLVDNVTLDRFGVDSLVNLKLVRRFEDDLGRQPSTLLFEHTTLRSLAEHFASVHADALARQSNAEWSKPEPVVEVVAARSQPVVADSGDIAIIGCSGRYPQANDLEEFWENLRRGRNCIERVPRDRWNADAESRESYTPYGGFISDVDKFDPFFFGILPDDAKLLDPQARVFLETAWHVLEDAGYSTSRIDVFDRKVGVFVGVMNSDYDLFSGEVHARGGFTRAHSAHWTIANRVSYHLDLHGPSLAIDTACSSSLTALHLAVESLRRSECALAIAGGVNLILHPLHYRRLCSVNMLARDNRCKSFGVGADGFVDGEGVGAVLLKPLREAIRDRDPIYAVIKATVVNAGGKTSGFTVPNLKAQAELVAAALERARVPARSLSYVEAHGTGTALGDPIEVAALAKAFGDGGGENHCALGSVKSNIGHLEAAAGIAGLTKILLQLREQTLVPTLHAEVQNPNIELSRTPFRVQKELARWPSAALGEPRYAGLSSFGAGGANAHVILQEYVVDPVTIPASTVETAGIFVLSAKRRSVLKAYADRLLAYLVRNGAHLSLSDLLYTLQIGRDAQGERLAIVTTSIAELCTTLRAYVADERLPIEVHEGAASSSALVEPLDLGDPRSVAAAWVNGATIPWEALYPVEPRRVRLPTYPFERRRCWFDDDEAARPEMDSAGEGSSAATLPMTGKQLRPTERDNFGITDQGGVADRTNALQRSTGGGDRVGVDEQPHDTEARVRRLAAKILKAPESDVDLLTDISEYGFDSINVMFMMAEIDRTFGIRLDPKEIVSCRTLRELAQFVDQCGRPRNNGPSPSGARAGVQDAQRHGSER